MTRAARALSVLSSIGTLSSLAIAAHTAINIGYLRRPPADPCHQKETVSVLIPARNEAAHIALTLHSVLAQTGIDNLEIIVLDDGSTDATADLVGEFADPRLTLITGSDKPLPTGWLGKP